MYLKEQQPAFSVEELIENLKGKKLIINDEAYAKDILSDISYFRLIKAYSLGLKPKNKDYNDGVTFEHIVDLYKFNGHLRQDLFSIIERIEVNLRCRIANYFSCKYGVLGYEDPINFQNPNYHNDFLDEIKKEGAL